jgi:hypothetical protein
MGSFLGLWIDTREGKGREGKGRKGKGREGKEREGKGREEAVLSRISTALRQSWGELQRSSEGRMAL